MSTIELLHPAARQELTEAHPGIALTRLIGDVKDLAHLRRTMGKWRPQAVFHAAAFKHVPLMEEDDNALAALRNNTLGTVISANTGTAVCEMVAAHGALLSHLATQLSQLKPRPLVVIAGDHAPPYSLRAEREQFDQQSVPAYVLEPK